ncbi:MAG: hypothetical protein VX675_05845, partial [Planctomycetota bacterium]|nr:hypothetical protein [Planctomycetota bacterium]
MGKLDRFKEESSSPLPASFTFLLPARALILDRHTASFSPAVNQLVVKLEGIEDARDDEVDAV